MSVKMATGVVAVFLLAVSVVQGAFYHTFSGREISPARYEQYRALRLVPFCAIEVKECDPNERRRLDYSCNNLHYPSRGTTYTPYRRLLPADFDPQYNHRPSSSGAPLPNARRVRVGIIPDGRISSKKYTHLVPNGNVAIIGDVTSIHDTANYVAFTPTCCTTGNTDKRCDSIPVAEDDLYLRRSSVRCLNLTKPITYQDLGCTPMNTIPERVNSAPPMLEWSIMYGNEEERARRAREGRGGRLRSDVINGKDWPPSGSQACLQNQRPRETRCHDTPVPGTNILIGANVIMIWMWRAHNDIARKLEAMNPCWDDERIYMEAREIIIAWLNQIWYYEMMASIMGHEYLLKNEVIWDTMGHVNDYDETLEPRVSIEYVIGTRWFHTIQEGRIKSYDKNGKLLEVLASVELTLRTGILPNNRTIEGITQGFFRQPTAAADHMIDPDISERILGGLQFVSDVMSSDITKGRAAGLPPYYKYRKLCGLPVPKDFDDLRQWMPDELVDELQQHYEAVEDIDIMAGILAEKRMPGAAMGPTLACIMADQLRHWRKADRFWYENNIHPGSFTPEQLYQIRHITMSRIICDYADEVDRIQPNAFLVAGPGNEMVDCNQLPTGSFKPWEDMTCDVKARKKNK